MRAPILSSIDAFLQSIKPPVGVPTWAVEEGHRKLVLFINHVLQQEPIATDRLRRVAGQVICARWRELTFAVVVTRAGLFDIAGKDSKSDLSITVTEESPLSIAQGLLQGRKPAVRIEGDVQLAAEVNWLADHVRWDVEEDLSRIFGDVWAHQISRTGSLVVEAARGFVQRATGKSA